MKLHTNRDVQHFPSTTTGLSFIVSVCLYLCSTRLFITLINKLFLSMLPRCYLRDMHEYALHHLITMFSIANIADPINHRWIITVY